MALVFENYVFEKKTVFDKLMLFNDEMCDFNCKITHKRNAIFGARRNESRSGRAADTHGYDAITAIPKGPNFISTKQLKIANGYQPKYYVTCTHQ